MPAPTEVSQRCDPRLARSRQRVVEAAVAVLREHGTAGLTVEAVSVRSGVAKTTIYRQFTGRDELHLAAFQSLGAPTPPDDSGDIVTDITHWLQRLNDSVQRADLGSLIPTLVDAAERSPHFSELVHTTLAQRRALLLDRLRSAIRAGQLAGDLDLDMVATQLVGPVFYRRFISRQAVSRAFVARLVAAVLTPLVCPARSL